MNKFTLTLLCIVISMALVNGCCKKTKENQTSKPVELSTKVKINANNENKKLILGALWILQNRTPEFFTLVDTNVVEIKQSKGKFTYGPIKTIEGTGRIEFKDFSGKYNEYNIANFLVHEATHIVDQKKGLKLTRAAEIRARNAEIAFLKELEKIEKRSLSPIIRFIEKEIQQIKDGKLYSNLD